MDQLRPEELARKVAAWHNRHPLAQRISPAQVQGIGWVALPFVPLPGPAGQGAVPPVLTEPAEPAGPKRLRDRVRQRLQAAATAPAASTAAAAPEAAAGLLQRLRTAWQRQRAMRAAFSEDFIAPISPRGAARWAQRHGRLQVLTAGLPVRKVLLDPQWARQDAQVLQLHVPTAAVELGARRARLLLSMDGAVLGPRLLSRGRMALAASPLLLLVLVLTLPNPASYFAPRDARQQAQPLAMGPATADLPQPAGLPDEPPVAPEPLPPPAQGLELPPPEEPALAAPPPAGPEAAEPAEPAEAPALATELPPDDPPPQEPMQQDPAPQEPAEQTKGNQLVRPLSPEAKAAARRALNDARVASGLPPLPDRPIRSPAMAVTGPGAVPAPPPPAAVEAAAQESGPVWALTTRVLRTRAESEQVQSAVRALLASHTREPIIVELMPVGDDWRVVCWPFLRREDAQLARALLLTRGLRLEPVEF